MIHLSCEHGYDIYDGLNSGGNNRGNGNTGGNGDGKDDNTSTSNGGANQTNNADCEREIHERCITEIALHIERQIIFELECKLIYKSQKGWIIFMAPQGSAHCMSVLDAE